MTNDPYRKDFRRGLWLVLLALVVRPLGRLALVVVVGLIALVLILALTGCSGGIDGYTFDQEEYDRIDARLNRPDPNISPLGTYTLTVIPRAADDPIWEGMGADTTIIRVGDKETCKAIGVEYPSEFVKVEEPDE